MVDKSGDSTESKVHAVLDAGTGKAGMVGVKKVIESWKSTTTTVTASTTGISSIFFSLEGPVEMHDYSIRWRTTTTRRCTKLAKGMEVIQLFPFSSLRTSPCLQSKESTVQKFRAKCNILVANK
jgi:hypothetical protein